MNGLTRLQTAVTSLTGEVETVRTGIAGLRQAIVDLKAALANVDSDDDVNAAAANVEAQVAALDTAINPPAAPAPAAS